MTHLTPRPEVAALPAYVPGARGGAGAPPIKLSSNESPLGPLPSVAAALERAAGTANRYPDMGAVAAHERVAESLGVTPDRVALGAGSVGVLAHILQAFCRPGDEVVYSWRSFEAYPILTALAGAVAVPVPLDAAARHDLPAMAQAISERTRVVLVCSPNNPTGPAVRASEFAEFLDAVPPHVLVVLDEAYTEYVRDPAAVQGLSVLGRPNVLVLRTFSKAYGLAGLRAGYAVGPASVIAAVRSCVTPFSVTEAAQVAVMASLDAADELLARVAVTVAERDRVVPAVRALGWDVPDAQGNFVWLPASGGGGADSAGAQGPATASGLAAALAALPTPILVRPFPEGVRITIGTAAENDALLAALSDLRR